MSIAIRNEMVALGVLAAAGLVGCSGRADGDKAPLATQTTEVPVDQSPPSSGQVPAFVATIANTECTAYDPSQPTVVPTLYSDDEGLVRMFVDPSLLEVPLPIVTCKENGEFVRREILVPSDNRPPRSCPVWSRGSDTFDQRSPETSWP